MKITVVVPARTGTVGESARVLYEVDRFAADVGEALSQEVQVYDGPIDGAPATGFLLVFDLRTSDTLADTWRVMSVANDRSTVMDKVETNRLAGAIESFQYTSYVSSNGNSYGVIGRKDVAERMKADVMTSGPYVSANYAPIANAGRTLPQLVAAYLMALAAQPESSAT